MAAFGSDTILKPLQNAMKMAKTAIQMDAENQHKVVRRLALGASYPNSTEETPGDEIKMFFQF
uniref:Uncharacterized protein n=1 Tax=Gadus morhua TaxID=8049 RepID=A0A8C5BT13_GADMO